jgi:hypothetical protein
MRRILGMLVGVGAGCSTAPVADFLDAVAPGGPGPRADRRDPPPPPPGRPAPELPPRVNPPDDAPPLPPVPAGFRPPDPDDEGERPARLRPGGPN